MSTAGRNARGVKNNPQVHVGMAGREAAAAVALMMLERSAVFQMAVWPRQLMPIPFELDHARRDAFALEGERALF